MHKTLFWSLAGVTLAIYAVMLGWSLPTVSAAAGGLAPFDLRPGGYSLAEAQQFLSALTADGAAFYRDVQHRLDLVFPVLIALTLFFAVAALLPTRLGRGRYVVAAPALLITVFDYLENSAVSAMLAAGPAGLTEDLVATASQWTVLKSGTTSVVMSVLLILLIVKAVMALRARLKPRLSRAS